MRVRGQSPILWRCLGQSQVGAEPGHAVVVDGLSYQEQQLLDRLPTSMSPGDVYQVARWSEVPIARARELMSVLDEAGVLTRDASTPASEDEVYWERVSDNPRVRTQALRRGVVGIIGGGRLAHELVALLAESGVGALLPEDEELCAWTDALDPPVRTRMPLGTLPDLVVTVEGHLIEPVRARGLSVAGVAHLPVVVREVSVRVGPLLAPGSPPCATCLDLRERDADPQWPWRPSCACWPRHRPRHCCCIRRRLWRRAQSQRCCPDAGNNGPGAASRSRESRPWAWNGSGRLTPSACAAHWMRRRIPGPQRPRHLNGRPPLPRPGTPEPRRAHRPRTPGA